MDDSTVAKITTVKIEGNREGEREINKDGNLSKKDAEPYIQAYLDECRKHKQTAFKVHNASKQMRMCKAPCE